MQKEGHKGLTSLERGKPCKNLGGKWQKNLLVSLANSEREKSLKFLGLVFIRIWEFCSN